MDPTTLRSLLVGEMDDATLRRVLGAVQADPAWHVLAPFVRAPEWIFQLLYRPTGQPYGFPAVRLAEGTWRFAGARPWYARAA